MALVRGLLAQERGPVHPHRRGGPRRHPAQHRGRGYQVNDALVDCLPTIRSLSTPQTWEAWMALAFARPLGIPAYIYDAVTSDELLPEARITGFKGVTRTSFCHVLNARATAHKYAESRGLAYKDMNLVVAHLGAASVSVLTATAESLTRYPMTPAPSPRPLGKHQHPMWWTQQFGKYTKAEMLKKLRGEGACPPCWAPRLPGDREAHPGGRQRAALRTGPGLQIAKGVGTLLGCFTELIDAVILTGGLAYSKMLTDMVIGYLHNLARVVVIPGEMRWRPWPWAA
ncbi:MAG: butyrate kinase [Dysosmobacter welbionis]